MDKYEWLIHTKILEKLWGLAHNEGSATQFQIRWTNKKPQEHPNGYGNR